MGHGTNKLGFGRLLTATAAIWLVMSLLLEFQSALFSDTLESALLKYLPIEPCAYESDHEFFDACFGSLLIVYKAIKLALVGVPILIFVSAMVSYLMYRKLTEPYWRFVGLTFPFVAIPTVVSWLAYSYFDPGELICLLASLLGLMMGCRNAERYQRKLMNPVHSVLQAT